MRNDLVLICPGDFPSDNLSSRDLGGWFLNAKAWYWARPHFSANPDFDAFGIFYTIESGQVSPLSFKEEQL